MTEQNQLELQRTNLDNIEQAWEGDLWDRKRLGVQLTNYVDRLNCGAVLALDARWGEGKTWFVRHWKKHLEDENHNVIYLDAFANDYLEDPFLVISSEIASKLDQTADKRLVHKFKKAAAVLQQGLLTQAPTIIASMISFALTGGIIPFLKIDNDSIKDKYEDIVDKVTDNIGEKVTEAIQKKIDDYEEEKQSLNAFKETLAKLAESLDRPLVFIIDELDRCRPDFAIRLIERIKHFFDIPKIVFVLVMDKKQFSKVVCHNYGYDEKLGEEYLDKFVDFMIPLPQISVPSLNKKFDHVKTLKKLLSKVGEESDDICLVFYLAQFNDYFSARQLQKMIHLYALLRKPSTETNIFLVLALLLNPEKLTEKIIKTVGVLDGIIKNQDMSGYVTDITRLDLEQFQLFVKNNLKLNAEVYFELIIKIKVIEINYLASENKNKEFLKLYSTFALQRFVKNHFEISDQFELYLKAHLWDENNIEEL